MNLLDLMSAFVRFDHDDVIADALDRLNQVDYMVRVYRQSRTQRIAISNKGDDYYGRLLLILRAS